jgi:hypothetical protein
MSNLMSSAQPDDSIELLDTRFSGQRPSVGPKCLVQHALRCQWALKTSQ